MMQFKDLQEAIWGTEAENNIVRLFTSLGYKILRHPSNFRNSSYDIIVCRDGITLRIEVKLNKYQRNLALEYRQRLISGKWVDSGYRTTNANWYVVENEYNKEVHIFEIEKLRSYVNQRYISNIDSKLCNMYGINPTVCNVIPYSILELDGFFKYKYKKIDESNWVKVISEHFE